MSNKISPLVSIIVPVYKTEQYLEQCINSILSQTYPNFELILVDDGSPDNSPAICDKYSVFDRRIHVIHKKNGGVSSSRKAGIEFASGDYIMFVDSDDWIEPDTLSACIEAACQHDAGCVMFSYIKEYINKSIKCPLFTNTFSLDEALSEALVHRRIIGIKGQEWKHPEQIDKCSTMWGKLYRKSVVNQGRIISERIVGTSEDTLFNIYALENCRITYIQKYFYHYRKANIVSITSCYKPQLAEKWDTLYELIWEYISQSTHKEEYQNIFLNRVACGMIGLGLNELESKGRTLEKSRRLKSILKKPLYEAAFSNLDVSYCDVKWKVFFLLCKMKATYLLIGLFKMMSLFRSNTLIIPHKS